MISGLHHISLLISSEKTLDFYKMLGFKEMFRKIRSNDVIVLLGGYDIQLEVFMDSRHPKRVLDLAEPLGPRHVALKVDNIVVEKNRLKRLALTKLSYDVQFHDISLDWIGESYCFFYDPDGNIIELHE